jgi:hypothetical protein
LTAAHDLARLISVLDRHHVRHLLVGAAEARALPVLLDAETLASAEISTWMHRCGGFDILAGLASRDGHVLPYEELVQHETVIDCECFSIRAAALKDIITAKEHANRPKDREALPELRAQLDTRHEPSPQVSSAPGLRAAEQPLKQSLATGSNSWRCCQWRWVRGPLHCG